MSKLRFKAMELAQSRKPIKIEELYRRSELFGKNVFNENAMRQYLTSDAYKGVMNAIQHGKKIDRKIANQVASSMKDWAL